MRISTVTTRATRLQYSIFFAVVCCVLGVGQLSGQNASISGVIQEAASGEPIRGATVFLTGTPLRTITDAQGRFALRRLGAGEYDLRVAAMGFAYDSLPSISLTDSEQRDVSLSLRRVSLRLQEVVVTASRAAERSDESSVSIASLPSHEVMQRNVTTLDQALLYVPGVTFNGKEQIDIRGAAGISRGVGSRVLMLLDGHPILSGDGGEVDFGSIPLFDLDRTEIVKGAYSAVYGSNAVGGVVNIITKPVADEPETVFRGHADAYLYQPQHRLPGEMRSALGAGVQHSRQIGSIGARASFGYEGTDGFTENGESDRWTGRVKLMSDRTSRHPWDVYGVFSRDRGGEFFTWLSADEPFRVAPADFGDHSVDVKVLTGATVTPLARANTLIRISPYLNINSLHNYLSVNQDWHRAVKPGFMAQLSWYTRGKHAITFGADGSGTWVSSNFLGNPRIADVAVFAQDEFPITNRLKGSLGLRVDHHKVNIGEAELALSPKVGLVLRLAPRATMRMSVGGGYRAPSAIEQFVSTYQFGFRVIPNEGLRGENAWSGEVGTTVTLFDRVRVDGALFTSFYRDLIGPAPAPGQPFVFQFQNVSRARVMGLDLGVNAQVIPDRVEVQAGYLFLSTEDRIAHQPLPYRSRHNVTGTVNFFGGLAGVDTRFRSRVEEVLGYPFDPRSAITIVDVRLGYRLAGVLWQLKFANILNRFYVDVQERNPGAPRSISITALHGM
jgi:outer membrane receptor for ferrienterochelin and colicins